MDCKIVLVFCYVTTVMFAKLHAAPKTDDVENCIVSLVIPQEKIKSTCDGKEKMNMKMGSIVSEITDVQRDISELNVRITKILAKDDNSQEIKQLSERLEKLENDKIPNLEGRLTAMEEASKPSTTFSITRKRLVRVLKPLLKKELNDMKSDLTDEITKQLLSNSDTGTNGIPNSNHEQITSEILYNQYKTKNVQQPYPPQSKKPRKHRKVPDLPTNRFSTRFDLQLESLARQFQYEADQSALDNEVPEGSVPPNFFQADGRFDPRMDRLIEIFKSELLENLDKHTEKVKTITNRHLNEIESKMSKILNIIEGFRTKYDTKLSQMSKGAHHESNTSSKIESLENDIKTLASGISSLRSNFFADPQFQKLFQQELLSMETKMSSKFSEYAKPLRDEVVYFKEKLENSDRQQHLTKTALQNFKADLRVTLHYMEKNISTLNSAFNETRYPEYPDINEEEFEHDLKVSKAVYFVESMKDDWPYVFKNLTYLEELHATDIDSIKTDFANAHSKYDQLKESQKELLEQIKVIQNTMGDFRDSLEEVERFTLNSALEENKWVSYDFEHSYQRSNCNGGKKYVKKTGYQTGVFVGVVLCNSTRYKIFLSDSLEDKFLDIGDTGNFGEDHCEFVGGSKISEIRVEKSRHQFVRIPGYYRHDWGQTPIQGRLSFFSPSPAWYECGVIIPE